ncbi:porin [Paraburkholderia sabiae]|jgi:predicted porin|uniref:Porin n=1 Tax=Paraburkholderia sabiae TaxID=273251 RepID=A0ABU9Q8P2_9BURK|nr:porin [Paraburkholderia sabiae]WJZ78380.1 porin [Paraburkholderia sabiae]CAD6507896.1 Outer membrane porin protein 32 [Paraburkholderia sabiae]
MKSELKVTALASLLAIAGVAHAQSSVTLYGTIDSGLLWQNTAAANFLPVASKNPNLGHVVRFKDGGLYSSLWGLKGTEDIGGGYKINFRLQGSFDSGTGRFQLSDTPNAPALFNQIATVGVSGPFGKFDMGRQLAPMAYAFADTDVRNAWFFGSVLTAWLTMNQQSGWTANSTNGSIGALYDSNALVYNSPSFYGFSAALEYAPGGVAGHFQGGTRESAVLKYSNFGLNVAAVYYNGHDTSPFPYPTAGNPGATPIPATGVNNNRFVYFGAKYTWKGLSVSGSFSNGRNPSNPNGNLAAGIASGDFDMWTGGIGYRFSPTFELTSGIYYVKDEKHNQNQSTAYVLGADYNLSKTTALYAQGGYVANRGTMNQTLVYGQPVAVGKNTAAGMVGIRHAF